jgi:hypothetical protein
VHWANAHLRQRPSFRWTKGQSCTNIQIGPLKWGCSAGSIPKHDLNSAGKGSEEVLEAMRSEGKNIMQQESYVVGDAIFCVYNSDSEDLIKEHSERSGVPASEISEIATVIKHNTSVVS